MSSLGPSEFDWSMRSEIYRVFAETGASPTSEQLAASLHASPEQITGSARCALRRPRDRADVGRKRRVDGQRFLRPSFVR